MILMYSNKSRLKLWQNINVFLGPCYSILWNKKLLKNVVQLWDRLTAILLVLRTSVYKWLISRHQNYPTLSRTCKYFIWKGHTNTSFERMCKIMYEILSDIFPIKTKNIFTEINTVRFCYNLCLIILPCMPSCRCSLTKDCEWTISVKFLYFPNTCILLNRIRGIGLRFSSQNELLKNCVYFECFCLTGLHLKNLSENLKPCVRETFFLWTLLSLIFMIHVSFKF